MALSEFQPERREFKAGSASFQVRGLTLSDFTLLIRAHLEDLDALFDLVSKRPELTEEDVVGLVATVCAQAPGFVANVIAIASDEPTAAPIAEKLPIDVQIGAASAIVDLTFREVGGPKKLIGLIGTILREHGMDQPMREILTRISAQ